MKKTLETSEWVLSLSLIVLLASLFILSKLHTHRKLSLLATVQTAEAESVEISIIGEVAKPGAYLIEKGGRLGDAVKKSRPKRFADLGRIDLDSPACRSQAIEIPRLKEVAIWVKGAVIAPVELRLPAGSRISDLKDKIALAPNADRKFLKRKRLLKPGETIAIPALAEKSADGV